MEGAQACQNATTKPTPVPAFDGVTRRVYFPLEFHTMSAGTMGLFINEYARVEMFV